MAVRREFARLRVGVLGILSLRSESLSMECSISASGTPPRHHRHPLLRLQGRLCACPTTPERTVCPVVEYD